MTKKKMIMYVVAVLLPLMLLLTGLKADVVCAAEKQYTITYKNVSNADNSGNPTKYTKTSKTITLKKPVRKGYDFVGWYSNSSLTKKVTKITKGSTGNKTLYAKWTAHKYNISFDGNGADGGKTLTQKNCRYGKKYVLSACGFTRKGYHFVGWNTKADGSGTAYEAGSYVKNLTAVSGKTIKLYAQWEIGSRATTVQIQKIFVDNNDKLCYAYIVGKNLFIVKTEEGMPKERLKLPMQHSSFGNIICDDSGYYYMVTGEPNKTENRDVDTMFITKYSPEGKVIKTVSSKGTDGNTKIPFYAGDCDIALNGNQLVVFYSRTMYKSGDGLNHQSDNVWSVDTESLEDFGEYGIYHSHSFAQRVVPFGNGFILSALGDGFPRAFSLDYIGYDHPSKELFHFWVEENTYSDWLANHYDDYYMRILNNTFSTHGDLVVLDDTRAALVAAAAPSMDYSAQYEKYGLFIQVFDVLGNLDSQEGYITSGERSGMSGCDGNEFFTDYGVKWLSLSEKAQISSVCAVNDNEGHLVILYMKKSDSVTGIYYLVTDYSGNVIKPETLLTTSFQNVTPIRPCILDGVVYFIGYDQDEYYNILSLDLAKALSDDGELPIATEKVAEEKDLLSVYEGTEITLKFDEVKVKSWTSSDEQVATVSKKGVISAEKNGTAEITGRLSDGSTYTCTVKVWSLDAESAKAQKIESDRVSKVTIPDGVKKIATGMFRDCKLLSSVKLPAGLTEIGEEAFRGCTALKSITLPENVTVIGRGAFRDCVKLETVSLPKGGENTFGIYLCGLYLLGKCLVAGQAV